jgi:hypothetical protein
MRKSHISVGLCRAGEVEIWEALPCRLSRLLDVSDTFGTFSCCDDINNPLLSIQSLN